MKTLLIIFTLIIMTGIAVQKERQTKSERVHAEINNMITINDSIAADLDNTIYLIHQMSDRQDDQFKERLYEVEKFNPLFW